MQAHRAAVLLLLLPLLVPNATAGDAFPSSRGFNPFATSAPAPNLDRATGGSHRKLIDSGLDNRVELLGDYYPLSAVGRIEYTNGDSSYSCSGTLIGESIMLTAAHCMFATDTDTWSNDIVFKAALDSEDGPHDITIYRALRWTIPEKYTQTNNVACRDGTIACNTDKTFQHDYAVVLLEGKPGLKYGWMGYGGLSCGHQSFAVDTAGYPGDKDQGESGRILGSLWGASCNLAFNPCGAGLADRIAIHDCTTYSGQSGSALWAYDADGLPWVVAVHVGGGGTSVSMSNSVVSFVAREKAALEQYAQDAANQAELYDQALALEDVPEEYVDYMYVYQEQH